MLYRKLVENHLKDPRVVLSDGKQEYTFVQLHERAMRYCTFFQQSQLRKGDRVVMFDYDPIETVIVLLSCIAGGYIFVPINSHIDEVSQQAIIKDCTPKICINQKIDITTIKPFECRSLNDENTKVYLIYTSGSEGTPKGVIASQRQILFCSNAINMRLKNEEKDRILCCLPISFDYGMYQVFLSFLSGAVLYLDRGDVIQRIPYLLRNWSITGFPTIPSIANLLNRTGMLRRDMPQCLRYITFTGEILPISLVQDLQKQLPHVWLVPMYGLTECKRVSVMPSDCAEKTMRGSCGLPLDGITVWLKDLDMNTGIGELVVEGENVMDGYWSGTDYKSDSFSFNPKSGKRMLYTGDLFTIDGDGFLYFRGRKNHILKIRGYRVSSLWIEERLRMSGVLCEMAVIGVPDELTGERAIAVVYTTLESEKIQIQNCLAHLPEYLQGTRVFFTSNPLPKNQNGKIDRKKLQVMMEAKI